MENRITTPFLTKFERARILSERANQISLGKSHLECSFTDPYEIALEELKERKIPMKIIRYLPNGNKEIWKVNEMIF